MPERALPPGDLIDAKRQINSLCDALESAFRAGQKPRIEDSLEHVSAPHQTLALRELLVLEVNLRIDNGETIDKKEYQRRFPNQDTLISDAIRSAFDLVQGDTGNRPYRSRPGNDWKLKEAQSMTPVYLGLKASCPACGTMIGVVSDEVVHDLVCNSCGNHIKLVGNELTNNKSSVAKRFGHFELLERLGMGGFGSVWKAHDTLLDRIVAVKILHQLAQEADEGKMLLREAQAAAQLAHRRIVTVHEIGRFEGKWYIVSEYVPGMSMAKWMRDRKLSPQQSAQLLSVIAEALQHAHQRGIVHRDLKPDNILIDPEGEPHITDFGLAKRDVGEFTMTLDGKILGTPAYMAPEQASGEVHRTDARSDIYALGVMLFELLTDRLPFRGSVAFILQQVVHGEVPRLRELNSEVPQELEAICLRCLEKNQDMRFRSAKNLAAELRRFLNGKRIRTRSKHEQLERRQTTSAPRPRCYPQMHDDPEYLGCIDRIVSKLVIRDEPNEVYLIRIDNWFDHKWLTFSGIGVVHTDDTASGFSLEEFRQQRVTFPPFNPKRVASQVSFHRTEKGHYEEHTQTPKIHLERCQPSARNLDRRVADFADSAMFCWFSSRTANNGRGSLMVYRLTFGEVATWFVSFQHDQHWKLDRVKGTSRDEIEELLRPTG